MKTLTQLRESFDSNPGNALGVTNHLTPINNIIVNIRNLFAPQLSIVVEPGEDGTSIKLHSSFFTSQQAARLVLDRPVYNGLSLRCFINQQGLDFMKFVSLGQFWVVYFLPSDIYGKNYCMAPCAEMKTYNLTEAELECLNEDMNGEEEMEDRTLQEIIELIDDNDKIKAASKLAELMSKKMELPKDFYWKAVKDQDGKESVALRHKTTKRRPFGRKIDVVKSIINIYNSGHDAIWVDVFDDKDKLDEDILSLIETILSILGASETNDPCIYDITEKTEPDPSEEGEEDGEENPEEGDENGEDGASDDNSSEEPEKDDDKQ